MSTIRRVPLPYDPAVCPSCGELIIVVGICLGAEVLRIIPQHPDRMMPYLDCDASTRALTNGRILTD